MLLCYGRPRKPIYYLKTDYLLLKGKNLKSSRLAFTLVTLPGLVIGLYKLSDKVPQRLDPSLILPAGATMLASMGVRRSNSSGFHL